MKLIRTRTPLTLFAALSLAALVAVSAGCDDDDDDVTAPRRLTAQVSMIDLAFVPETLTVASGTEVTWTNNDAVDHTVRSGVPGSPTDTLNSGTIPVGGTYTYTFTLTDTTGTNIPDTIDYFCELHPDTMTGVVIVQ